MRQRRGWPLTWFFAGPFVVIGVVWLTIFATRESIAPSQDWLAYLNHSLGPFLAVWLLARGTPGRQIELAVWSGLASVALFALLFLVPEVAVFSWKPARAESSWLVVGLLAVLSLAGAIGGAWVARRQKTTGRPGPLYWMLISATITIGLLMALLHGGYAIVGLPNETGLGWQTLVVLGGVIGGGFVTQILAPHRMIPPCGSGALCIIVFAIDNAIRGNQGAAAQLLKSVFGAGVMFLFGMLGALLACKIAGRQPPVPEEEPPLPPATAMD